MYENRLDGVQEAGTYHAPVVYFFCRGSENRTRVHPLCKNTQQVYAGMTYARGAVNEDYMDVDSHLGAFFCIKISVKM